MSKTIAVLTLALPTHPIKGEPVIPVFVQEDRGHEFWIDGDVWDDMGRPDTVTITVEPGDTLNAAAPQ